jgi:Domain of unknown function (DUF4386)
MQAQPTALTGGSKMTERSEEASPRLQARIAGILYLINILGGFFAIGVVPAMIVVHGNPAVTAHNILGHELLYRLGLVVHLIFLPTNIPLAIIFYNLFKVVNRSISRQVVFLLLVGTAIEGVGILIQFAPLFLLQGGHYSSIFNMEQLHALAYLPLELVAMGYNVSSVFFGLYCISIGYLVFRSTFLPRTIGVLLAIAGLCYLTNGFANFLAPEFASHLFPYIQLPSLVGEGSLTLWLIVMGVNVPKSEERANAWQVSGT